MLVSMTGFGQGEASNKSARVTVEIRTVNHRYFDVAVKLPKVLTSREHDIKELLKNEIRRGRVSVTVNAETALPEYDVSLNVPLMEHYVRELTRFAKKHSLPAAVDINTLATLPEVFHLEEQQRGADELWPLVERSLKEAVGACSRMRREEGKALETDIRARIKSIEQQLRKIERRAPRVVAEHNAALKERLVRILDGVPVDNDRWMTEIALLSDKLDFTEEVIRLKSHIGQIKACLEKGGAVAKKLTYLLQEVHREATTIGSKASDAEVIEYMVSLKEDSERLREQVQNLE